MRNAIMSLAPAALFALGTVGGGCISSEPNPVNDGVPQRPGIHYDVHDAEQAETAIVAAQGFIFPVLVTGFNDFSFDPSDPEFVYLPDLDTATTRVTKKFASLMGWSTSSDGGLTWTYRGKVYPPPRWALIWGDPSMAVDPHSNNVVYFANLAVSNAVWNDPTFVGRAKETTKSPGCFIDGFCVAKSTDAGLTFGTPNCFHVDDPDPICAIGPGSDRTAITVAGDGTIFLATIALQPSSRITVWTAPPGTLDFKLLTDGGLGDSEPRIVTDPNGDIWVGGTEDLDTGNDVLISHWNADLGAWDNQFRLAEACGIHDKVGTNNPGTIGTDQKIANGHTYDFAVGYNEAGVFALRAVVQSILPNDLQYIRGAEINNVDPGGPCHAAMDFSTLGDAGEQFQPSLQYTNRGGTDPQQWWTAFLSTAGVVDPTQNYVRPRSRRLIRAEANQTVFWAFTDPHDLAPPDWYACIQDPTDRQFWGDYFGLTQFNDSVRWWSISTFTTSRFAPPCKVQSEWLGNPMHVASQRW